MLSLLSRTFLTIALGLPSGLAVGTDPGSASYVGRIRTIANLSEEELAERVRQDPASLGSMSVGEPNNGRLLWGMRPTEGALFEVVEPEAAFGTEETVHYLEAAVARVQREFPGTPPLHVGHLSRPSGGYLSPHLSHQSGRDVDLGFYYAKKRSWYRRGTPDILDLPRTWALVRALVVETDVEMILVDRTIIRLLESHATAAGENKRWLHQIFRGDAERPAIIRHARGHATHLHVRFYNPVAETLAERAYPFLAEAGHVPPVKQYHHHKAKKGDTLGKLAKRYGTTVKAIQAENGIRGTTIQVSRIYRIPRAGGPPPRQKQLTFPPRRLPS